MWPPPLLEEHPRSLQVVLAGIVPAVFGAVTGYFLGVSEGIYLMLSVIGIVGGVGAGFDHLGTAAGAKRGLLGGTLFGAAILIAHEVHGATAKVDLPDPAILLIVITALLGMAFGALGGRLRERMRARAATH